MTSFVRSIESSESSGEVSAVIDVPKGDWEISALHVVMGGTRAIAGIAHGHVEVRFEQWNQYGSTELDAQPQRLLVGHATSVYSCVMDSPKRVKGPGRLKSFVITPDAAAHTMTATVRRVLE